VILFALGLFVSNDASTEFSSWRVPGVLQRFGVTYFVVSLVIVYVPHSTALQASEEDEDEREGAAVYVLDVINHKWEWIVMSSFAVLWLLITFQLDVPGCGKGYLGPGGIGDYGDYQNCTGGVARYVDEQVLGLSHIYQTPTCATIYQTGAHDPEGILGCLTSIVMTFLGLQAGRIVVYYKTHQERMIRWGVWSAICGIIAIGLSGGTQNEGVIPINKNLWSLSFILAQSATGFFGLALCYFFIDVKKWWSGGPFVFVGLNSIAIYVSHECLDYKFPFHYSVDNPTTHAPLLAENLVGVGCWVLVAAYMYWIKFFVKV